MFVCFTFKSSVIKLIYSVQLFSNLNLNQMGIGKTQTQYNGGESAINKALDGSTYPS
jgi:hypothetical protein